MGRVESPVFVHFTLDVRVEVGEFEVAELAESGTIALFGRLTGNSRKRTFLGGGFMGDSARFLAIIRFRVFILKVLFSFLQSLFPFFQIQSLVHELILTGIRRIKRRAQEFAAQKELRKAFKLVNHGFILTCRGLELNIRRDQRSMGMRVKRRIDALRSLMKSPMSGRFPKRTKLLLELLQPLPKLVQAPDVDLELMSDLDHVTSSLSLNVSSFQDGFHARFGRIGGRGEFALVFGGCGGRGR